MRRISIKSVPFSCVLLAVLGCGADDGRIEVYPVHGKVLVKGQPAEGATVTFYSTTTGGEATKAPIPTATTDANGEFHLRSYEENDGAPAGEFKVTVVWPAPPPANASGIFEVKDRLASRFADPQKTTLSAKVAEGENEIPPFELQ